MIAKALRYLLPALLALAVAAPASAVKGKGGKRTVGLALDDGSSRSGGAARKALVIGNAAYPGSPLPNTKRDARDVAKALEDIGFTVHSALDLNLKGFRKTTNDFLDDIGKGDIVFVFYAGHGVEIDGTNYLVPIDFSAQRASDVAYEAYPLNQLLEGIQQQKPAVTVVVLDACRNNPFLANRSFGKRGLAQVNAGEGTLIAYATSPGKTASDGAANGNGVFTASLVKYLKKPGVDIEGVFKEVSDDVATKTAREQIPWRSSSIVGRFYLAGEPAAEEDEAPTKSSRRRPHEEEEEEVVEEPAPAKVVKEEPRKPLKGRSGLCWEQVVRKPWFQGASAIMPFTLDDQPHVVAYQRGTGKVITARIRHDGEAPEQLWQGKWKTGWQGFMPFMLNGSPHFFLYNADTGQAQYEAWIRGARDSLTKRYASWRKGYTWFVAFELVGFPAFMGYAGHSGDAVIWRVDGDLKDPNLIETNAGTGMTTATTYKVGETTYYFFYMAADGIAGSSRLNVQGDDFQVVSVAKSVPVEKGLAWVEPVVVGKTPYQLGYRAEDGAMVIYRGSADSTSWKGVAEESWGTGITGHASYEHEGRKYLMLYKAESGELEIRRSCQ
ncbi:MAG: caspase family protein [Myxococcota bacterium]